MMQTEPLHLVSPVTCTWNMDYWYLKQYIR